MEQIRGIGFRFLLYLYRRGVHEEIIYKTEN